MDDALKARVERWLAGDPDARDRQELEALLATGDEAELAARFSGRLEFGTAGLRGALGAGENRMNTAVVRQTTAGLAAWIEEQIPGAAGRGVVVGFDARHRSAELAADVAGVLLARGFVVHAWDRCTPTPTNPWLVRDRGAAAGVQVTASHNPPEDSGYKVFWHHGAQIVPPHDRGIAGRIEEVAEGPASAIEVCPPEDAGAGLWRPVGEAELSAYQDAVLAETPHLPEGPRTLRIVYTALHGVGQQSALAVLGAAGFEDLYPVAEQAEPDGDFPTVHHPNPEHHDALVLCRRLAAEVGADLVVANDPDADRLAVLVPDGEGYRVLTGNEVGVLLGEFCLRHAQEERPFVAATIVSSRLLSHVAAELGARCVETLTGFKWIMEAARRIEAGGGGERFVYGYEEAIGYTVGRLVPDKDGISAVLAVCCLAQELAHEGRTLLDALDDLYGRHGAWLTGQALRLFSGPMAARDMESAMVAVRAGPPEQLDGLPLLWMDDYLHGTSRVGEEVTPLKGPRANLVCLGYARPGDDAQLRVLVRPSGTEPKVKVYFEWHDPRGLDAASRRLEAFMAAWAREDPTT